MIWKICDTGNKRIFEQKVFRSADISTAFNLVFVKCVYNEATKLAASQLTEPPAAPIGFHQRFVGLN